MDNHLNHLTDLPVDKLRAWARDPVTQVLLRHLRSERERRVDSIIALSKATNNETFARAQALGHAGAEQALGELADLIKDFAQTGPDA